MGGDCLPVSVQDENGRIAGGPVEEASKVFDAGGLAASIRSYGLALPEGFVTFSAYALPPFEVLLGLYLLAGLLTKASALTASGLMVLFTAALVQGALHGLGIDCGCFDSSSPGARRLACGWT